VVYVACHDTEPPSGQSITTDTTHLLVRALASKKAKEERKGASGESAAKRQRLAAELEAGPALTAEAVRSFTAEKVKAALSARGLVQSGNKEACVERVRVLAQPLRSSCACLTVSCSC